MQNRTESSLRVIVGPARGEVLVEAVPPAPSSGSGELPGLDLALADWESDSFSLADFDRYAETVAADAAGAAFEIRLSGERSRLARAARQVALRCQRLAARRNAASSGEVFDRVLAGHRRFRDLPLPSAAAGYAHALDAWQWLLRLDPEAGLAVQLAALFHEAWRLAPPEHPAAPLEHSAASLEHSEHSEHSDSHANACRLQGAWLTDELLAEAGVDLATRVRVHRLIAGRERPPAAAEPDRALLDEADALSWLSFGAVAGSGGSADCPAAVGEAGVLGAGQAARQIADALACLRPAARVWLRGLRLRGEVIRLLEAELARQAPLAALAPLAPDHEAALIAAEIDFPAAVPQVQAAARRGATAAAAMARKRLAAGMAGSAGLAPTRVSALLARAARLGDLAAHPASAADVAAARTLAATGARPASGSDGAGASRARRRLLAVAAAKLARTKRSPAPAASCRDA